MMNKLPATGVTQYAKAVEQQSESGERWVDLSINPQAAEEIGKEIARRVAGFQPQIVITWMRPDEAVLAHIVARILNISSARANLDLGLITIDRHLTSSTRILLLTTIDENSHRLNSLNIMLSAEGHIVVAAASILSGSTSLIDSGTPQFQIY